MKKIISLLTSAVMTISLFMSASFHVIASIYEKDYNDTLFNYIIKLPGEPLAKYPEAQSLGVDKFIFTDEGQSAYETIEQEHEFAKKYLAGLLGKKSLSAKYEYTAAYNGFSVVITHNEYKIIKNDLGSMIISDIYELSPIEDETEKPDTLNAQAESRDSMFSYSELTDKVLETVGVSETNYKGDGTVIAVIDNSFDRYHEFLSLSEGTEGRLTKEDVINISPYLSASLKNGVDYYVNNKIPYAFNYCSQTTDTLKDFHTHGTHVAGIAAGNGEAETSGKYDPKGVAPDAQLLLMSDFSLSDENLIAAYDDCLYLGADVINTSYGASGITLEEKLFEPSYEAINNITGTGVMFCSSAGNDGKLEVIENNFLDYSTGGFSNNLKSVLSVGSAQNYFQETYAITVNENNFEIVDSEESILSAFNEKTLAYVPIPGNGEADDYKGLNVKDKIALVSRGKISFSEKAYNAAEAGAVGLIVYDNDENGELLTMACQGLPSGFISFNAGMQMIEQENKNVSFSLTPQLVLKYDKEVMSSFSSWDFTETLLLKPDITGFGGNIISSVPDSNKKLHNLYSTMSGTSMSSPQIAGLNALLKQYLKENASKYGIVKNSDYTELMAKLLMSTATPISTSDGLEVASPRVQGNGLANVSDAINTPCYISSNSEADNYRPKISLGENASGEYLLQFNIHNISDTAQTYQLSADVFNDAVNENDELSWNTQRLVKDADYYLVFEDADTGAELQEITVEPSSVKHVTAKIILTKEAYNNIFEVFENGTFIDGFINLKNETSPALTLSFMTFCGNWNENNTAELIEQFAYKDPDNEYASFLSDGVNTAGLNLIELYSLFTDEFDNEPSDTDDLDITLSHPYFSPLLNPNDDDNAFNNLFLNTCFKRRCYDVKVSIYNSDKEEVYSEILGSGNMYIDHATNERTSNSFEINWDFRDTDGKIHNNAAYTIWVTAKTPLSDKYSSKVVTQSFTIDTEKPVINNCSKLIIGDTEYLMIEAADNGTLQGAVSYDVNDESYPVYFAPANTSYKNNILIKLPEYSTESFVEVYDMAGNYETIDPNNVTKQIYYYSEDVIACASDEESFADKISFFDETGRKVTIPCSFSYSPAEVYENGYDESILIINGFKIAYIPVQAGLRGDANGDNNLTAGDAAYIAKMLAHQKKEELPAWADYNQDGKITAGDAAAIAHYLANKHFN